VLPVLQYTASGAQASVVLHVQHDTVSRLALGTG
jgi:hypothetical protein